MTWARLCACLVVALVSDELLEPMAAKVRTCREDSVAFVLEEFKTEPDRWQAGAKEGLSLTWTTVVDDGAGLIWTDPRTR